MRNFTLYFHKYIFAIILIGFGFIITTETTLSIQLTNSLTNDRIVEED